MNILVTGGAGFIGSNFIKYMLHRYDYRIINLDLLTYAGNLRNLQSVESDHRYQFVKGDISDKELLSQVFSTYEIDVVINFAAESHVDRSIERPETFLHANVLGTQALLDTAKLHWKKGSSKYNRDFKTGVKFLQVSTDEVYGTLGVNGLFTETTNLAPNSPYSASKAGADLMVRAYYETYGLPVNVTRCSNNYGPYQFPEKLIPLTINNCTRGIECPVYGDGMQIRDWLHVNDHCSAVDLVLHHGDLGEIYNVGGNNEKTNIEIVKHIVNFCGKSENLIRFVPDRPGHDRRYAIDNTKIKTRLGWRPSYSFYQGLEETINWYMMNADWMENIVTGEYRTYYTEMYNFANDL